MSPIVPSPVPTHIQMAYVAPGTTAAGHSGGRLRVSGQCSALLEGDTDGVFSIAGLETLEFVPARAIGADSNC